jgi:hypothetical protein
MRWTATQNQSGLAPTVSALVQKSSSSMKDLPIQATDDQSLRDLLTIV